MPSTGQDEFPSPAHHTIPDTSQDAVGLLGHLGTLLAHIQPTVQQYTNVPFHRAAFQLPKPVGLPGVVVTKMQDPTLGPIETHSLLRPINSVYSGPSVLPFFPPSGR